MVNQLVYENLKHRPVRTGLSILAIAFSVTLVLTIVGLSDGIEVAFQPPEALEEDLAYQPALVAEKLIYRRRRCACSTCHRPGGDGSDPAVSQHP